MKYLFTIWGKVKDGKRRGKRIGFPTANMRLHKKVPEGVYISETKVAGRIYQSATFIGPAITYGECDSKAETYILDFQGSLYGKWITVRFRKFLRENFKFKSEKALKEQIRKDIVQTGLFFTVK